MSKKINGASSVDTDSEFNHGGTGPLKGITISQPGFSHNCGERCERPGKMCPICIFNKCTDYIWRGMEGRVLTLIDASIVDKQQNKAIKDVLRREMWESSDEMEKMMFKKHYRDDSEIPLFERL